MIISHDRKTLFIGVPKNGSQTARAVLGQFGVDLVGELGRHPTLSDAIRLAEARFPEEMIAPATIYAFWRDPVERFCSAVEFHKRCLPNSFIQLFPERFVGIEPHPRWFETNPQAIAQDLRTVSLAHIEELALLDTLVRDIQDHAMAFRAQPISSVFGRVPRLLRELAASTGKHVRLAVHGESTELDKTVIERLSEPMTHLIRNAVDHGIEPPEERRAAGKDPEGTLTLSAEQKAGRIVIRISDDGRGIDREKVLAKAIRNGLVSPDAELTDDEIHQLVFAPGFSTAATVSNISGRGVGMDVVRQNVKDLGGRITIESTPGNRDVSELSAAIQSIAAAAATQAESIAQINAVVSELDRSTQQNAAMAEECTAAASSLSQEASSLNGALSQFEVGYVATGAMARPAMQRAA